MQNYINLELQKSAETFARMQQDKILAEKAEKIVGICVEALKNNKKIMFCGNGGSAADSQHLAAELVSKLCYDRPGLNALALSVDTSALTAIGNDYGFDRSFARQVEAIGQEGDILFGISTSGKSKNVLEAVKVAKEKSIVTIGFLGEDGRDIGELADYQINIPASETPKIQEGHIAIGHIICALIEEEIFGAEYNPKNKKTA